MRYEFELSNFENIVYYGHYGILDFFMTNPLSCQNIARSQFVQMGMGRNPLDIYLNILNYNKY